METKKMKNLVFIIVFLFPAINLSAQDKFDTVEQGKNVVQSKSYDITGKVIAKSRSYFDNLGKSIKSQSLDIKTDKVWATEVIYDKQGRPALKTSAAPIGNAFGLKTDFIRDHSGGIFDSNDIGTVENEPSTVYSNTYLGNYYYDNDEELYRDNTQRPYSRVFYDELNPGKTLKTVGGNKVDTDGDGQTDSYPQGFSYTMPAAQELYYAFGREEFMELNNSYQITNKKIQKMVAIDAHGNEAISFNYDDGRVLASARSGLGLKKIVKSMIGEQGYVDVHISKGCNFTLIGDVTIYDLKTGSTVEERTLTILQDIAQYLNTNSNDYTQGINNLIIDFQQNDTSNRFNLVELTSEASDLLSNIKSEIVDDIRTYRNMLDLLEHDETSYGEYVKNYLNEAIIELDIIHDNYESKLIKVNINNQDIYYEYPYFLDDFKSLNRSSDGYDFYDNYTRIKDFDIHAFYALNNMQEYINIYELIIGEINNKIDSLLNRWFEGMTIEEAKRTQTNADMDDALEQILDYVDAIQGHHYYIGWLEDRERDIPYLNIQLQESELTIEQLQNLQLDLESFDNSSNFEYEDIGAQISHFLRIVANQIEDDNSVDITSSGNLTSSSRSGIEYEVNYYDYSLNYYDDAGNLTSTLPPIGFDNEAYADYNLAGAVSHIKEDLKSHFKYNTLGQLLYTSSPDEGEVWFKYRTDGQIRFSQNSKQKENGEFSYTNYDSKARPIESGVYTENNTYSFASGLDAIVDKAYTYGQYVADNIDELENAHCNEQHFTLYDVTDPAGLQVAFASNDRSDDYEYQTFVSGNVSKTFTQNPSTTTTWYSYDIFGRVTWIVQQIDGLDTPKTIDYEYDDITGAVTKVYYQKGVAGEEFIHRYTYDEDDYSLVKVETSTDGINFTIHADYEYYEAGGLKRTVLAEGLQGIDYVYNVNGALKAINHPSLDPTKDPGGDTNDVFGMMIDYYKGDYNRSGVYMNTSNAGTDQYNGNIKAVRWNNRATDENTDSEKTYAYGYDRNNWLTSATYGQNLGGEAESDIISKTNEVITEDITASKSIRLEPTANTDRIVIESDSRIALSIGGFAESVTDDYGVSNITYDANGNIQSLKRNKNTVAGSNKMDNMNYHYDTNKPNQLNRVEDIVTEETDAEDIKTQAADNYEYNSIGQLEYNNAEGIAYIYNASGLVSEIKKDNTTLLKFFYNDRGHRVKKESYNPNTGSLDYTDVYVRDAAGTPMAIYRDDAVVEHTVYGASRLGVFKRSDASTAYELTDHLGNVRAVIKKDNSYTGTDYYPGGMAMPLRNSLSDYRYQYQGQELDPETGKPAFQLRLYDPRINRWLTTDPYGEFHSPYLSMGNNWINTIDPDGGKTDCPDCPPETIQLIGYDDTYEGAVNQLSAINISDSGFKASQSFAVFWRSGWNSWDPNGLGNQLMNFSAAAISIPLVASSPVAAAFIDTAVSGGSLAAQKGMFSMSTEGALANMGRETLTEIVANGGDITNINLLGIATSAFGSNIGAEFIGAKYSLTLSGGFRSESLSQTGINLLVGRANGAIHSKYLSLSKTFPFNSGFGKTYLGSVSLAAQSATKYFGQ